jgi:hypothetical protein
MLIMEVAASCNHAKWDESPSVDMIKKKVK